MSEFKNVGLVARMGSEQVLESLRRVLDFLVSQNVNVLLEDTAQALLREVEGKGFTQDEMASRCDLIIAVGGDGNILGAARSFSPHGVPILGINRGRLGFLADVSPEDIEKSIGEVLQGKYVTEEHFLLEGEVSVKGVKEIPCALNEVLIHSAKMPKMLEFNLYIDDIFVYNQYSDGLIISSPTGSTAYALSAGGPIMHPSLDAIVLVPMFPHQLNSRPLLVPGDSELRIVVGSHNGMNAKISFDSQVEFEIEPGESICVKKKREMLKLLHPLGHNFYGTCRSKLDWANDKQRR
ncbi:MAG: NAD+ kinase [Candidatus Azotimanducaceae bacterium]|jgi:NAD+ kinase